MIAAATLAIGFVTQPSQIMLQVDGLREQLAAKVITGTTTALTPDTLSVTGYQNPALTGPAQEVAASRTQHGGPPLRRLHDLGVTGPQFIAVHGVHLAAEDIGILAAHGCHVVHCPISNMKLGSGIAPVAALIGRASCRERVYGTV